MKFNKRLLEEADPSASVDNAVNAEIQGELEDALDEMNENAELEWERYEDTGDDTFESLFIFGPAGCGKTARVKSWCKKHGIRLQVNNIIAMDPADLYGLQAPVADAAGNIESAKKLRTDLWNTFLNPDDPCVWFLDEFNRVPMETQNALLPIVLNHKAPGGKSGDIPLPGIKFVVCAGNPETYAGVEELDTATKDRFVTIDVTPSKPLTLQYLNETLDKDLERIERKIAEGDPRAVQRKMETEGKKALAKAILTSPAFQFTGDTLDPETGEEQDAKSRHITSPRSFSKLIDFSKGTKEGLLKAWPKICQENQLGTIRDILTTYVDVYDKATMAMLKNSSQSKALKDLGKDDYLSVRKDDEARKTAFKRMLSDERNAV